MSPRRRRRACRCWRPRRSRGRRSSRHTGRRRCRRTGSGARARRRSSGWVTSWLHMLSTIRSLNSISGWRSATSRATDEEEAVGELHDVGLVDGRHLLAALVLRVGERGFDDPLAAEDRDRLDRDSGVGAGRWRRAWPATRGARRSRACPARTRCRRRGPRCSRGRSRCRSPGSGSVRRRRPCTGVCTRRGRAPCAAAR